MGLNRTINMIRNLENWYDYLFYKYSREKEPFFEFRLRNHYAVNVPSQVQHEFKESVFEQIYYQKLPSEIYHIESPVVIDIGANVGFFTLFTDFKLHHPRVYCFEPIQRNFALLQRNLAGLDKSRIHLINKAVSNSDQEIILQFNTGQSITTSASIFHKTDDVEGEKVGSITLTGLAGEYKLSRIDLLKLDCEGAEYGIFYDTPKSFFKRVYCMSLETHVGAQKNENTAALAEYIVSLGFKVKTRPCFIWAYKTTYPGDTR
ncbi:MAG: SAM-dependent methyltransferase [Bacteroidetes bacterium]|nr:SAM-dependent methyltransferase [Bacteroidota bacterium]